MRRPLPALVGAGCDVDQLLADSGGMELGVGQAAQGTEFHSDRSLDLGVHPGSDREPRSGPTGASASADHQT